MATQDRPRPVLISANTVHALSDAFRQLQVRLNAITDQSELAVGPITDYGLIDPRDYGTTLDATTLQAALNAIGSARRGLLLPPGTWNIGADLTIPANVTLVRSPGGLVSVSTGVTLRLDGGQEGPLAAWIGGDGAIVCAGPIPEVYPEWWGAVGDGATNDEVAVQRAIDALPTTGGTVCCVGQYALNTIGVVISGKSQITLKGSGRRSGFKLIGIPTQSAGPWSAVSLAILDSTHVRVQDLWIDGNSLSANPIVLSGCTECTVERVTIIGPGGQAGIGGANNTRNAYRDNVIRDSAGAVTCLGIYVGNTNTGQVEHEPIIAGNRITNMTGDGIAVLAVGGTVSHNVILACFSGIIVPAYQAEIGSHLTISGNYVRGCVAHGIQSDAVDTTDFSQFVIITGNVLEENNGSGIYVVRARDWVISGNICRNNNFNGASTGVGIQIDTAKRVLLVGNLCEDTRSGASRTQANGISVVAQVAALDIEDVQLTGNLCRNNAGSGIIVATSGSGTIDTAGVMGNLCVDNGGWGLFLGGSLLHVLVTGNTALGNTTQDLRVDAPPVMVGQNIYLTSVNLVLSLPLNDTTPSVSGRTLFTVDNTVATSITTFDDGIEGQEVSLIFNNANTTLVQAGIALAGGVTYAVPAFAVMRFVLQGGYWWEMSRSLD